jgi:hypothetical protein
MSVLDDMIFLDVYCLCLHIRGKDRCLHETLTLYARPSVVWNDTLRTNNNNMGRRSKSPSTDWLLRA